MQAIWFSLYSVIAIPLFWLVLRIMSLFNAKVRRGIKGRSELFDRLAQSVARMQPGPRVWFHASSMGEFEQAKPIIAALKQRRHDIRIIASFFSPSGYEHSLKYPLADCITYIPLDTASRARQFVDLLRPTAAVMVRYDVWPNIIRELDRRHVPIFIANATMRSSSPRFLPGLRGFHRILYDFISNILTVSEDDVAAFRRFGLRRSHLAAIGDTRFDQVHSRSLEARKRRLLPAGMLEGKKVMVAGSSWPEDEEVIIPAFLNARATVPELLLIVVPHEPTIDHLEDLEQKLAGKVPSLRFSALNEYAGESVIIVDSIGILLMLYSIAHIAYVGGSFRQGIHNVLEAAVYGIPVLFGPRHKNSQEPGQLVEHGGAFVVSSSEELKETMLRLLSDDQLRKTAGENAAAFVQKNTGATERFLTYLEPILSQTAKS